MNNVNSNHYSSCVLLDFLVCSMSTPYVFLHFLGFFGAGFFSGFGVSNMVQIVTGLLVFFGMVNSNIFVFESRSSSLQMNRFRMTRTSVRIMYHVVSFCLNSSICLFLLFSPDDQSAAKLDALKLDPCPTREFFINDILIISTDIHTIHFILWICGPVIMLHMTIHLFFHAICTIYYLYVAPSKSISVETQRNQRKFFMGIIFQTTIPMVVFLSIVGLIVIDGVKQSMSQSIMNSTIIAIGGHGIVESISVILVHRSYRRVVLRMLKKQETKSKITI
ncbi:hypothetical protein CRE_05042 [Caenorhabditis remanei]|uniref:Serpentine Receptor, class H n=1 Tax=Caenorhabditis remanei TaxID=31234 RepID=E3MZ69_CAERE|nr:hypothetical protein CRE_05042 [Caenorhabditis remanei]